MAKYGEQTILNNRRNPSSQRARCEAAKVLQLIKQKFAAQVFGSNGTQFFNTLSGVLLLLGSLCLGAAFLVTNKYFPWASFYSDFLALLALGLLALGAVMVADRIYVSRINILCLVILLIIFVHAWTGLIYFPGDAYLAGLYVFAFMVAIITGYELSRRSGEQFFIAIAIGMLIVAAISCFIAMYQWLGLNALGFWIMELRHPSRAYSNLGQPNHFATLLCLGIAALIYLWDRRVVSDGLSGLLGVILLCGLVLSGSRTPLAIFILFSAWWIWKRRSLVLRLNWPVVIIGVTGYCGLTILIHMLANFLLLSESGPRVIAGTGGEGRIAIWQSLLGAVGNGPVWGYGWNQVSVAQVTVAAQYPPAVMTEHSHNLFLDFLVWCGPLLGGAIILLICAWGLRRGRLCRTKKTWFAMLCIGAVLTHGMLEYPLEYAYFLVPVGLFVGAVEQNSVPERAVFSLNRVYMLAFIIYGFFMLGWVFSDYRQIEEEFRKFRFEAAGIISDVTRRGVADVVVLTQLREYLRFAETEATENMSETEIDAMRKVAFRYPQPPTLFRYALALGMNGYPEKASAQLLVIQKLFEEDVYQEASNNYTRMAKIYMQLDAVQIPVPLDTQPE